MIGALGDIHGDFAAVARILARHPDITAWVCVGDVADEDGRYEGFDVALHFIKGNNESFDAIAAATLPPGLHFLENGTLTVLNGISVASLGGTFAPTWYDTAASDLPHPRKASPRATARADKRRHFVREEVTRCLTLAPVDLLLTHEAARPYVVANARGSGRGIDAGKTPINELLAELQPKLHLFGHHHRFSEQERQGVRSVGLDAVSVSYLLISPVTLHYQRAIA